MNTNDRFESSTAAEKLRNLGTLAVFSIIALFVSLIVMNSIAYPISVFAMNNTPLFNQLIIYGVTAAAVLFILIKTIRRTLSLKKSGLSAVQILFYFIKRPFYYTALSFGFLIISLLIIGVIYFILTYNYYFIHTITNG